jgi:Na+-transporting methylmalonyl-CoA/oxaloacetate decarboxylase gamma subunit
VLNATWFVLAGMGIVFATLALLVVVMSALNRWLAPHA